MHSWSSWTKSILDKLLKYDEIPSSMGLCTEGVRFVLKLILTHRKEYMNYHVVMSIF